MSTLLSKAELAAKLERLAADIAEALPEGAALAVVGIRRRGETLADRLLPLLEKIGSPAKHHGVLDITLYRDDLTTIGPHAVVRGTELDFDLDDTWLVLVDDVLFTGRSVRAALDALTDFGRPRAIRLAVLVDRGWREYPIQPDFAALKIETTRDQIVKVMLEEMDGVDEVELHESA